VPKYFIQASYCNILKLIKEKLKETTYAQTNDMKRGEKSNKNVLLGQTTNEGNLHYSYKLDIFNLFK
jgi:hypothetical protein